MIKQLPIAAIFCSLLLTSCLTPTGTQKPAGVVSYGATGGAGSTGIHTVLGGDTVYTVSQRYNLPLRDIITVNNLSAPYYLQSGYRLKLPPPNEYRVKPTDTLSRISRLFGVSVSEMAKLNNMSEPFVLEPGQTIRLPSPQPKLEEEFAGNMPPPSFASDLEAGTTTSVPVKIGSVESEVLSAPVGTAAPVETAQVSATSAKGFPPQPAAQKSGTLQVPENAKTAAQPAAKVETVAAKTPSIAPKVPARAGRFMRPVDGKVISKFGPKDDGLHNDGINIKAPKGTAVRAAENGVIAYTGNEMSGYGNLILVKHADRYMTAYAHMDKMLVKKGDVVKAGQSIGTVGATGGVDSSQLHFEVRKGTEALNPDKFL